MECNPDGTVTLVKELDKDFVIPKKQTTETTENMKNASDNSYVEQQSVVNNSYPVGYDYNQYYNQQMQHNYQQYQQYWLQKRIQQDQDDSNNYNANYSQQKQNRGVKRPAEYKESPKNQETTAKYKDSFGDLHDASLPEELRKLLQPLYCKLCSASLNSNLNARMHYTSKNHNKKIKMWLMNHSLLTGEPLHKRALVHDPKTTTSEHDPSYFYCEVCDLPLTGRVHAEQHYCGKNHQKALTGKKAPSGKGFYNDEGKWIRTLAAKSDVTGRDGFGQAFALAPPEASANIIPNFDATGSIASKLRCDVCNIAVTSIQQMEVHIVGSKHQKKMKQLQGQGPKVVPKVQPVSQMSQVIKEVCNDPLGLADLTCSAVPNIGENGTLPDEYLARFRTPSGQYYCKTCDMSVNSDSQFAMHVQSKKHLKKINAPKA